MGKGVPAAGRLEKPWAVAWKAVVAWALLKPNGFLSLKARRSKALPEVAAGPAIRYASSAALSW